MALGEAVPFVPTVIQRYLLKRGIKAADVCCLWINMQGKKDGLNNNLTQ